MKRAAFLHCVNMDVARFKLLAGRGQLPFISKSDEDEPSSGWKDYSLGDAIKLRLAMDMIGGEGKDLVHHGLPPSYVATVLQNALHQFEAEVLDNGGEDIWVGVVISEYENSWKPDGYPDSGTNGSRFSAWFVGELNQLPAWVASHAEQSQAAPVRLFIANMSNAYRFVHERALQLGRTHAEDFGQNAGSGE